MLKVKRTATILYSFLGLLILLFLIKEAQGNGDFSIFLDAAKDVRSGNSPYQKWYFVSEGNYGQYFYSPFFAFLLIPFTYLPAFVPKFIWLLLNVFLLGRIGKILHHYMEEFKLDRKTIRWIGLISLLFSIRFILYNFNMLQLNIMMLWGMLEFLHLEQKGKSFWAAMVLAFVIDIKLLPIVLIPYLIYRSKFKLTAVVIALAVSFHFLPSLFLGVKLNVELLQSWWMNISPSNPYYEVEAQAGQHSLTALIPSLLTEIESEIELQRNLFNLSIEMANRITLFIRLGLVCLSIYFLGRPFRKMDHNRLQELWEVSYLILLIPLIFPIQQKYAFIMILPAVFYLAFFLFTNDGAINKRIWLLLSLSFALLVLSTDGVIGRSLYKIGQHYKLISWGALLLIPTLMMARPQLISKKDPIN